MKLLVRYARSTTLALLTTLLALPAMAVTYANTAVPFNWIDSSTQTVLDSSTVTTPGFSDTGGCGTTQPIIDDTLSPPLNLGFNFIYGGVSFNSVRVMSNGRLQFNNNTTCGFGSPVTQLPYPDASLTYTMRIYGNDLDPTLNGASGYNSPKCASRANCYVSYGAYGVAPYRSFVVTWFGVPEWTTGTTPSGSYNLQVILQENGEFIYQYGTDTAGPSNVNAQVGWEIDTNDYNIPSLGFPTNNSAIKFYIPQPVAEYRMEQPSWTGVAGEVKDTSGKGNNATLATAGGAALPTTVANAPGYICRGASIAANATSAAISAINTNINVSTGVGSSGTITFWYKPVSAASWNGNGTSVEAMLFDGTISANNYFYLQKTKLSATTSGLRFVIRDSSGTTRAVTTAALALNANNALHIGVSWTFNNINAANNDHIRIYANGVQVAQLLITSTTLSISPSLGTLYIGDNRSVITDAGATNYGNSANGVIDEFRIYNYEGALALIQRDMNQANVCLDHYAISHGGTGNTCNPTQVTVFAHDIGHSNVTMPNNTTTITLSTSTGKGDWSLISGYGTLTNGTANDGIATYLWNGEYQAVLGLTHTIAGTVNINVTDGQLTEFKTPPPNEDPDLVISSACTNALSFLVSAPSTGSTCGGASALGAMVTVSAKDAAAGGGNLVTTYTGTVNLTTSTGHGSWAKVPGQANGTLSGSQYTFVAADNGVAKFYLSDFAAETLTATVTDAVVPTVNGTSGNITYGAYSFQVATNDTMGGTVAANASTIPVAGRPHAMTASLYNGCVVDTGYVGNKNLDFWYSPASNHPAGAAAPKVSYGATPTVVTLPSTIPASNTGSNNSTNVPFALGVSNFNLVTTDVGIYSIGVRDDTHTYAPFGGIDVAGTSPILTVRPFAVVVDCIKQGGTMNMPPASCPVDGTANPGGSLFAKAGTAFKARVAGYLWSGTADVNNDGIPDSGTTFAKVSAGGIAANFAHSVTLADASPYTPATGVPSAGTGLSNGLVTIAGGSGTTTTLSYSEVGTFTLTATPAANYLGSVDLSNSTVILTPSTTACTGSCVVGRFSPDHFVVAPGSVAPGCGTFTYFGQDGFSTTFTLTAQNLANATTQNYTGPGLTTWTSFGFTATGLPAGSALSASATAPTPTVTWTNGQASVTATHMASRPTPPSVPASVTVNAQPKDSDNITMAAAAAISSSPAQLKYGRLRLTNAYGSNLLNLLVPVRAEYVNGFVGTAPVFSLNTSDSCTAFPASAVAITNSQVTTSVPPGNISLSGGQGNITLNKPTGGGMGTLDLALDLNAGGADGSCNASHSGSPASLTWLQYAWCGGVFTKDPNARIKFGSSKTPFIYLRERY